MATTPTIASTKIEAVAADGAAFKITVEVGTPYPEDRCWACPVALHGLYEDLSDQRGEDALQALCLAIGLADSLLSGFVGGTAERS